MLAVWVQRSGYALGTSRVRPEYVRDCSKGYPTSITMLMSFSGEASGMDFKELPPGWERWSVERTKAVLAYRPDVFDSSSYPAPCLPTIYVSKGKRGRRPGPHNPPPDAPWYVTLYLEPEVNARPREFDSKTEAVEGARSMAGRFTSGEFDYRDLYQVPREDYLDALDRLTGEQSEDAELRE